MGFNMNMKLFKIDEEQKLVYGRATQEVLDKANEIMDYESSKPMFEKWSNDFATRTNGKSYGNVRIQHDSKRVGGKIAEPLVFNDVDKAIDVCVKVSDDTLFSQIKDGLYTGFSVGGSYGKQWKDEDGVTHYTAIPSELSIVDNPCVGTATIMYVKADGTTETKTFKKEVRNVDELQKTDNEVMQNFKEALAKADTKKAFSFEEIRNRLLGALTAQITTPFNCGYFYIVDTYADSVIIQGDLDGDGDQDAYRVNYTMDGDGIITLGKIEAVRHTWIPAIDEDNPNQEFGLPKAHKADEATDLQKADESEELSKADKVEKTAVEIEPKDKPKPEVEKTSIEVDEKQEEKDKEEVEVEKRDFSADERKKLAEEGKAMPDGSFPIENKEDLKNAIRLAGQAKDKAKAQAFIRRRAKALGAEDMIPESWGKAEKAVVSEMEKTADMAKSDVFEMACKAMENADDENVKKGCSKLFHKIVEKGLYCKCDKCSKAVEDTAEKATSDTDLHKAVEPEAELAKADSDNELAKAMGVIEDLKKGFDALKSDNDELKKRVQELEDMPVAGGAMVATGTMALDKTIGGNVGNPAPQDNSEADVLRKMISETDSAVLKEQYSKRLATLEMRKVFG